MQLQACVPVLKNRLTQHLPFQLQLASSTFNVDVVTELLCLDPDRVQSSRKRVDAAGHFKGNQRSIDDGPEV